VPEQRSELTGLLIQALERAWNDGSPVVGDSAEKRERQASIALRRIKSFDRRGVPADDRRRQIVDLAKGLAAQFASKPKPNLVGPLIKDYEHVAEKLLEVYSRRAGDSAA